MARLAAELAPDEGLWSNLLGTWALAVYGPWAHRFEPNDRLGAPHPVPERPHFAILDPRERGLLEGAPPPADSIVVFVCHEDAALLARARSQLESAGARL